MPLFHFFKRRHTEALLETLAKQTANVCRKAALERLDASCARMSVHELRGYVRGRISLLVKRQAAEEAKSTPLRPIDVTTIARLATERLVQTAVRDLATWRPLQTETRRAA